MALRPGERPGRVGPHPAQRELAPAWCPGTRPRPAPPVGSPRTAASPASRSGRSCQQLEQAAVRAVHLLAGVEAPGHVDRRLGDAGGQVEHDGQATLHVRGAEAPQRVALEARRGVVVGRHRVEMPGEDEPRRAPRSVRATTLSPRRVTSSQGAAPQRVLDQVGQRPLLAADRRDGDQLGRGCQKIAIAPASAQVLAPWSRRTSLSCALSWRSPSVSRLMTSTHGRKNSPPGNSRRRLARTATHHGGTTPRRDLLAGLGVDDGDGRVEDGRPRRAPRPVRPAPPR